MGPQNSTLIQALLGQLSTASTAWYAALLPYAKSLFFALVGFQLLWVSITFALGRRQGDEFISTLFILVIDVGFFYSLILHPDWILGIINSFRQIGRTAGHLERLSPDAVIDAGLGLASAIIRSVTTTGLLDFAVAVVVSALIAIAVLASFAFLAARMVLILAEIFFAVNVGPILLAFSGLSATKYIATQYVGYVIGSGVQLLVMYLLIGAGLDIAASWTQLITQYGAQDVHAVMLVGIASASYAILAWNLPKIIGGLAAGAPQMSSGSIGAATSGVGAGLQAARAFGRGSVNTGQSFASVVKAAGANFGAQRAVLGKTVFGAATAATGVTTAAVAASGVNSLLGRHGHRSASERVWSSTAKAEAKAKTNNSADIPPQDSRNENGGAEAGTASDKVA